MPTETSDQSTSGYTEYLLLAVFISVGLSWTLHAANLEEQTMVSPETIDLEGKRWVTRTFVPDSMFLRASNSFDLDAWEAPFIEFNDATVNVFDGCTVHAGTYNSEKSEVHLNAPITMNDQCVNEKRESAVYFQRLFANGTVSLSFESVEHSTSSDSTTDTYLRLILKREHYRVSGTVLNIPNN